MAAFGMRLQGTNIQQDVRVQIADLQLPSTDISPMLCHAAHVHIVFCSTMFYYNDQLQLLCHWVLLLADLREELKIFSLIDTGIRIRCHVRILDWAPG